MPGTMCNLNIDVVDICLFKGKKCLLFIITLYANLALSTSTVEIQGVNLNSSGSLCFQTYFSFTGIILLSKHTWGPLRAYQTMRNKEVRETVVEIFLLGSTVLSLKVQKLDKRLGEKQSRNN